MAAILFENFNSGSEGVSNGVVESSGQTISARPTTINFFTTSDGKTDGVKMDVLISTYNDGEDDIYQPYYQGKTANEIINLYLENDVKFKVRLRGLESDSNAYVTVGGGNTAS